MTSISIHNERGFTIIELLTVVGIIGVVSALGLTSFYVYKSDAAYASAARLVQDSITAVEVALSMPDQTLGAVPDYVQTEQGQVSDPAAKALLEGIVVPRKMKLQFSYDPTCESGACVLASVQANHCQAEDSPRWIRYGDGVDVRLEHIAGTSCS